MSDSQNPPSPFRRGAFNTPVLRGQDSQASVFAQQGFSAAPMFLAGVPADGQSPLNGPNMINNTVPHAAPTHLVDPLAPFVPAVAAPFPAPWNAQQLCDGSACDPVFAALLRRTCTESAPSSLRDRIMRNVLGAGPDLS